MHWIALSFALSTALASETWQQPPSPIADLLDAAGPPAVGLSPDGTRLVEIERPTLPALEELSGPVVKVAGVEIDPRTSGAARAWSYTGIAFRTLERHSKATREVVDLPEGSRIRDMQWSSDGRYLSFNRIVDDGIELWVTTVEAPEARRLTPARLHAAYGQACDWLPGDQGLICKLVPEDRGEAPQPDPVPPGPRVDESVGRQAAARTYANLLKNAHDEALFEHWMTSEVVHVALDGTLTPLIEASLIDEVTPSPDGRYLLVRTIVRPFSRSVPVGRFPRTIEVLDREQGTRVTLDELPLADDVPITFGSTRTGRRSQGWRSDRPATLWWVEALDGGDAGRDAEHRDAIYTLDAPFQGDGALLWRSTLRFGGISFAADGSALVEEWWYTDRTTRSWWLSDGEPRELWTRSFQDEFSHPGSPLTVTGPYGRQVLRRTDDGALLFSGRGVTPDGIYPFLDRFDPATGDKARLWQSADPWFETVVDLVDDDRLLTRRQSAKDPVNYFLRPLGRGRPVQLTDFADHAPQFASVHKEVVRYTRADGLELSGTLYLPPGHDLRKDGPLPTLLWVYPNEFRNRDDAAQVTATSNTFSRPWGPSPLYFLLRGWAVLDDPTIPIVGEGDEEPNDTYVEQLVAGAEAAVSAMVERGVTDPDRVVIGGHSYGAFTTANLLAHTDLFKAGIARSGAYNRSLTPFGFQGEQRSYWEARDVYVEMSPFTHAGAIDEPLLLIHGADDSNSGTWPMQSERLYEAVKGLGGTIRYVELPYEGHGYRARESVGHVLWEMIDWAERWTAPPAVSRQEER